MLRSLFQILRPTREHGLDAFHHLISNATVLASQVSANVDAVLPIHAGYHRGRFLAQCGPFGEGIFAKLFFAHTASRTIVGCPGDNAFLDMLPVLVPREMRALHLFGGSKSPENAEGGKNQRAFIRNEV